MFEAGKSIQKLGRARIYFAIMFLLIAILLLCLSLKLFSIASISPFHLLFQVVLWLSIITCLYLGKTKAIQAKNAFKGAKAEKQVSQYLNLLKSEGWKMEYNIPLPHWGDADIFIKSPRNKYFVIDVKSNKGSVIFNGRRLALRYSSGDYNFPGNKDILKSVRGQAATLRNIRAANFVRPILCFTEANLLLKDNPILGVHISNLDNLVDLLRFLNYDAET